MMKSAIMKSWRDSAALIVLSKRSEALHGDRFNYDVLLQTRTRGASFRNSVVFPGGVSEAADASPNWLHLLKSFGYTQADFDALHRAGSPVTPIFQSNPIERHVSLRITAIRETFEELGLLICSRADKKNISNIWADHISDLDVKHWQNRVSKKPEELFNLCKEFNCYPDIWSLHYWSNWLSPPWIPKRFDTAFFVAALDRQPPRIQESTEVAKVEWLNPFEILGKSREVILYPPQNYELNRLAHWSDVEAFVKFAKERSSLGADLYYHAIVQAKDGKVFALPGDDLYPQTVDYYNQTVTETDKTVSQLRESSKTVHRFEFLDSKTYIVFKNFKPNNMDMGNKSIEVHVTH